MKRHKDLAEYLAHSNHPINSYCCYKGPKAKGKGLVLGKGKAIFFRLSGKLDIMNLRGSSQDPLYGFCAYEN